MHLKNVRIYPAQFPSTELYPFNLNVFHETGEIVFNKPVTLFAGENGTGKTTLIKAIARRSGIHIWEDLERSRFQPSPYENDFYKYITVEWIDGKVPGSFFSSQIFQFFALNLDEWALSDPGQINYFGGKSLMSLSHGQSLMAYFRSRYKIKGLYVLDEPETALSPKTQLELLELLTEISALGHAQFLIATHSPILLSCPGADIYSFDSSPVKKIAYKDTEHFKVYNDFFKS